MTFTLFADSVAPSSFATRQAAIDAGRLLQAASFEVWDESTESLVFSERPVATHLRFFP